MLVRLAVAVVAALLLPAASAQKAPQKFDPGGVYICPHNADSGIDCYLDAVVHLYTMCKHVKSIEIIEFGHAQAQEGVNGAKSEYCIDKQRINIARPYAAALREATPWRDAVEHLRELQAYWLSSMNDLKWRNGEAPQDYDDRTQRVYDELSWRIEEVRVSFQTASDAQAAKPAPVKAKSAPKAKAATTAKQN